MLKKLLTGFLCLLFVVVQAQTPDEVEQIRRQANMGNAEAQFQLAFCYMNGVGGLTPDPGQAMSWARKSADKGYAPAECFIGMAYEMGIEGFVTPDPVQAVKWYRKSADQDYAEAQLYLGNSYMNGFGGLTQSSEEAVKWWMKSARQGLMQAEAMLGMYYKESGDKTASIHWLEKALASAKAGRSELDASMRAEFDENFINPLEEALDELKNGPRVKTATYISTSESTLNFGSGVSRSGDVTVYTDGSSFEVSLLPSWCTVVYGVGNFSIICDANTGQARRDWFKVSSGDKDVRVYVEQAAGNVPRAEIQSVWVMHNVSENIYNMYSRKGMQIHVKFTVDNMKGRKGDCVAWFYFSDGSVLKDYNRQYRTTDGQVSVGSGFNSIYERSIFNDYVLFIPYDELHLAKGAHNLIFKVGIFDHNNNQIATSDDVPFTVNNW